MMEHRHPTIGWLAIGLVLVGCGGGGGDQAQTAVGEADATAAGQPAEAAREAESWIEYSITGDFEAEGRDVESIICSETEEGWSIAARGAWTIDIETYGVGVGAWTGEIQVTVPEGTDGAPSSVVARRMKATGTGTLGDLGVGAMGLRKIETDFAATGLRNDEGQSVDFSGNAVCLVF